MALKNKYVVVISFILALVIFSAGVLLGWSFEKYKSDTLYNEIKYNELDTDSYLTEQQFIEIFGGEKCVLLGARVRDIQQTTRDLGNQLSAYGVADTFTQLDYDYLKRKYFIFEIRFLNIIEELNNNCDTFYDTILFFYDIDDIDSEHQGAILDSFSIDELHNPVVLSIDRQYNEEPLVSLLVRRFNITEPSIVINNALVLPAVTDKQEIIENLHSNSERTTSVA